MAGLRVPAEFRGFVFRTVIALEHAGREVTVDSVVESVSRWLSPEDVSKLAAALEEANE